MEPRPFVFPFKLALSLRELSSMAGPAPRAEQSLEHEELFSKVVTLVRDYLTDGRSDSPANLVIDFKKPEELKGLVDLRLEDEGKDDATILELCKSVLKYSVNTRHPHFFNQLFTGADEIGLLASFISTATNTNVYTYEMAPVYTLMETEVLQKLRELVGWEGGEGDGIFSPGGSLSNFYGIVLARHMKFETSKTKGVKGLPQMVLFVSEQAHYSSEKAATWLGIGTDNVVKIKSDSRGRMIPGDLEKAITQCEEKEDYCPLIVVATLGTTVYGAFDPLPEIADICEKHSVWMHVDGCFGASILMSGEHRHRAAGVERADSMSWNPHKSLGVPLQCSVFLTRHKDKMKGCNCANATYLFQQDKILYDVAYDTGDKSVQCGRLNDVFKFWLMWKQRGTRGFEAAVNRSLEMTRYLARRVKEREGFQPIIEEPDYVNVCFWYFPPKMRHLYPLDLAKPIDEDTARKVDKVAPIIKSRMIEKGSVMVTYQPRPNLPNFFRMTLTTPTTERDMDWLLDEIEALGSDIIIQ